MLSSTLPMIPESTTAPGETDVIFREIGGEKEVLPLPILRRSETSIEEQTKTKLSSGSYLPFNNLHMFPTDAITMYQDENFFLEIFYPLISTLN